MRLLFAALLALPVTLSATGLPSLRLSGGARAAALAEAVTTLPDAQALNPAALQSRGQSAAFSHAAWIQDTRQDYLHMAWARGQSVWGLSGQLWQTDDLERRTGPSTAPLGHFGVYEGAAGLSYARRMDHLRVGLRLNVIRQSISTDNASGAAADFGLIYAIDSRLHFGASLRNLGSMGKLNRQATDLPLEARLGAAYTGLTDLLITVEAQQARDGDFTFHVGGEYRAGERLRLRAGYQNAENRNLSAGLGLVTGRWIIDYAYVPFSSGLGDAHRITLLLESPSL